MVLSPFTSPILGETTSQESGPRLERREASRMVGYQGSQGRSVSKARTYPGVSYASER